ncbi:MAG: hypothetical protein P4L84_19575 [Isosphaeraceae bacterium]|nr:hypothetical protein [Isosphaeraceae bacterium]
MVLLALSGFLGNVVSTLADHGQYGFFRTSEWVGVVASAKAVSSLAAVLVVYDNRPLVKLAQAVMAAQVAVALLGFSFHVAADLTAPAASLWDRFVYGAPLFAPLLFAAIALAAALALGAVTHSQGTEPAEGAVAGLG